VFSLHLEIAILVADTFSQHHLQQRVT